jgi:photosystem II stability/assembly factor-like uncharacterized protein
MKQMLRLMAAVYLGIVGCAGTWAQAVSPAVYSGLQWRLIGPFRGGRAVAASGIPGSGTTFFFGSVDGGVWKTENAGVSWVPLFDGQPTASIGALAVAPSNSQVIYAGTGESDIRTDLASGDGVYKSSDGGKTWTNIGLKETRQISRIVVDPKNADVVYVGALGHAYGPNPERGVFKSTDGGKTWKQALNLGPEIGASDLAIAAGNPAVLFAGTWQAHRPPWSVYGPLEGGDGGIYRSTDSGANWTRLQGKGLPDGKWGRVGVAVSADGKRVYALVDSGKKGSGLYRSDDGGDSWTLANGDSRLTSRSWYFQQPTIDPNNPDIVFVPNVALFRMEAGGTKMVIVRGAPGGDDYHQLWVDPANSARMVLATDQGTTVSVDGGATWSTWFNQPTGQFYHVTTDNGFPYQVLGAQQDSGSAAVYSRTDHGYIWPMDWAMVGGGESGWIVVDPKDNDVSYATSAYGGVSRYDRRTSFSQDVTPWPMPTWGTEVHTRKYRAPWTPVLVASQAEKGTLYYGTQYVMKTTDGGLHWEKISPDLTGAVTAAETPSTPVTVENAKERGYGAVYSIATSPLFEDLLWAGSDTGLVHFTRDGGKTWTNVTPPEVKAWNKIAIIEASHFDPATAYIAVEKHRLDDRAPYAYRTRDYGKTWQPIAQGIGANAFLNAIREDPQAKGLLFAGTELGVYVSFDAGDHWQPLQFNLPVTSVRDLVIHGDDLVIATHGRAFWTMDNITPLRQIAANPASDKPRGFAPAVVTRVDNDSFLGSPFPPDEPVAKNPPNGAVLDYYLPAQAKEVKLEIRDGKGNVVRHFTSAMKGEAKIPQLSVAERWFPKPQVLETSPGMHRFVWDLRWSGGGSTDGDDDDEYGAPQGPKVAPGYYQAEFTVDGAHLGTAVTVKMDPRSKATQAELDEQQRVGLEIFALVQRSRAAVTASHSVASQLAERKSQWEGHRELQQEGDQLAAAIAALDKGSSGAMGLSQASGGLQGALRVVESGDRTIPQAALDVYQLSAEPARQGIAAWEKLKAGQLAEMNQRLQAAGFKSLQVE